MVFVYISKFHLSQLVAENVVRNMMRDLIILSQDETIATSDKNIAFFNLLHKS